MVQIVREEHEDEYWQKPLREAILNIGNSWAGAIIRKQNHAAEYAKNAANRAHKAYIAQIGIKSREKIAGAQLAAAKSRNTILDNQYASSHKLQQRKVQNAENHTAYLKGQDVAATNAIAAVDELKNADGFMVENGYIKPKGLTKEDYKRIHDTIKESPTIWAESKTAIFEYKKRQKIIAGRLSMLRALQKANPNKSIYSKVLYDNEDQQVTMLNFEGTEGEALLNNLADRVTDENSWKYILKSYEIDPTSMKEWQSDDLANYAKMLKENSLFIGDNAYKGASSKANVLSYNENKDFFSGEQSKIDADSILGKITAAGGDMNEDQKESIRGVTGLVNAAAIDFMQETNSYFTNPIGLKRAIQSRIGKVVQKGDHDWTDPLDKEIKKLVDFQGDENARNLLTRQILHNFIQKNNYVAHKKLKSIIDNPAQLAKIINKSPNKSENALANDPQASKDLDQTAELITPASKLEEGASEAVTTTSADFLERFSDDNFKRLMFRGGIDIAPGVFKAMGVDPEDMKATDLAYLIHSGNTDGQYGKFTKKLDAMKKIAMVVPKNAARQNIVKSEAADEVFGDQIGADVGKEGKTVISQSDWDKAKKTRESLDSLYEYQINVTSEMLKSDPLFFDQEGRHTEDANHFIRTVLKEVEGSLTPYSPVNVRDTFADTQEGTAMYRNRLMFERIFKLMGYGEMKLQDDGSDWKSSEILRKIVRNLIAPTPRVFATRKGGGLVNPAPMVAQTPTVP